MNERDDEIRALHARGLSDGEIGAQRGGMHRNTVARARKRMGLGANVYGSRRKAPNTQPPPTPDDPVGKVNDSTGADGVRAVSIVSDTVRTLEGLLEAADIDPALWDVLEFTPNKWDGFCKLDDGSVAVTELWQAKARLRPNAAGINLRELGDSIIADIESRAPTYPHYPAPALGPHLEPFMLEVSPFDLHIGALVWGDEVDDDNYDSAIARGLLRDAIEDILRKAAGFPIERILFPVGNDLLHADTPEGTTRRGTRQDVDTRPAKMLVAAERAMVGAIDRLMQVAPVDVIVVPGNHDTTQAFSIGRILHAWYRNTDRVTVDAGPTARKYVRYGVNLLGFTHGSEEKMADLPLIMAGERRAEWAATTHHEWHIGHTHKRAAKRYGGRIQYRAQETEADTFGGVVVRTLPSLKATDAWHYGAGYVKGQRACEAYLWARDSGYGGHLSSNVRRAA